MAVVGTIVLVSGLILIFASLVGVAIHVARRRQGMTAPANEKHDVEKGFFSSIKLRLPLNFKQSAAPVDTADQTQKVDHVKPFSETHPGFFSKVRRKGSNTVHSMVSQPTAKPATGTSPLAKTVLQASAAAANTFPIKAASVDAQGDQAMSPPPLTRKSLNRPKRLSGLREPIPREMTGEALPNIEIPMPNVVN